MTVTTCTPLPVSAVQVDRQRRHQRLAFAGAHLGDLAVVQHHAADQLDVEVAHLQRPLAAPRARRRRPRAAASSSVSPLGDALAELVGLGAQRGVARAARTPASSALTLLHDLPVLLQQPVVAAAEDRGEKLGQHAGRKWRMEAGCGPRCGGTGRAGEGPLGGAAGRHECKARAPAARRERTANFNSRPRPLDFAGARRKTCRRPAAAMPIADALRASAPLGRLAERLRLSNALFAAVAPAPPDRARRRRSAPARSTTRAGRCCAPTPPSPPSCASSCRTSSSGCAKSASRSPRSASRCSRVERAACQRGAPARRRRGTLRVGADPLSTVAFPMNRK